MNSSSETVQIIFDGAPLRVPAGITVAAAVMGHAHAGGVCRNAADGTVRAPYCQMGVCFECLMDINDQEAVQSCLVTVEEGMRVARRLREEMPS